MEYIITSKVVVYKDTNKNTMKETLTPHENESMNEFVCRVTEKICEVFLDEQSEKQRLVNRMINYLSSIDYLEGQDEDMDEILKLLGIKCGYNDLNETFWTE